MPNGEWVATQTITDSITGRDTYYGEVLSVDNDWMALSNAYDKRLDGEGNELISAGSVHLSQKVNDKWVLKQVLFEENPVTYNNFGKYVALKGDLLVVGIPNYQNQDGKNIGAITIFKKNENVSTKIQSV